MYFFAKKSAAIRELQQTNHAKSIAHDIREH